MWGGLDLKSSVHYSPHAINNLIKNGIKYPDPFGDQDYLGTQDYNRMFLLKLCHVNPLFWAAALTSDSARMDTSR